MSRSHCSSLPGPNPHEAGTTTSCAPSLQCGELISEAEVETSSQTNAHAKDFNDYPLASRRHELRLIGPEGVEQVDLAVRRVDARAGDEQRVMHSVVATWLEHSDNDGDTHLCGYRSTLTAKREYVVIYDLGGRHV